LAGTENRVRQLQALVVVGGLCVVNCSESATEPALEGLFEKVISSLTA
jgi:hypothetical protein